MRGSIVAFVVVSVVAVLVLSLGLAEGRRRVKKADQVRELEEQVAALEKKLDDMEKRLRKLEGKAKK
jgi:hypothetical protein